MAHQEKKRYCRGCKCTADASQFISDGKQYKQCHRCRARIHDRKRSEVIVVCDCGREVLTTSLRDHLRTLYHEKRMTEKAPAQKAQKAHEVARAPMRKPMSAAVSQQPKPVSGSAPISAPKPVSTPVQMKPTEQTKIVPKAPSSFIFRKATAAAPVTIESLRTKLKQVQTTPVPQK